MTTATQAVKKKTAAAGGKRKRQITLVLLLLPFLVMIGIFNYAPLFGWSYAFVDYTPASPFGIANSSA